MLVMKSFCGLPLIFARRGPFGVTQTLWMFARTEMSEVSLRGGPEVRWAGWREAKKIPETAQHEPHARTAFKAVNTEASCTVRSQWEIAKN